MYGIEILVDEHEHILDLISCIKQSCYEILKGKEVDTDLFRGYIDFARNYADRLHHGKEELILFRIMVDELGAVADKLINHGMLIEHDYGRLYLTKLDEALDEYDETQDDIVKLDIIANAMGYGNHLTRHIEKENSVVYTFAERQLNSDLLNRVDDETKTFETEAESEKKCISGVVGQGKISSVKLTTKPYLKNPDTARVSGF